MKKWRVKILLVFMAAVFAAAAFAFEPVTLKDDKTGMTAELYPIPDEEELLFYGNMRFGYSVNVPSMIFTEVVLLPDYEDGMILESKDGTSRFRVTGGYVMDNENDEMKVRESFNAAIKAIEEKGGYPSFELEDDNWLVTWREGDKLHIRKFLLKKGAGVWSEIEIYYDSPEGEVHPLARIIDESINSLVFGEG